MRAERSPPVAAEIRRNQNGGARRAHDAPIEAGDDLGPLAGTTSISDRQGAAEIPILAYLSSREFDRKLTFHKLLIVTFIQRFIIRPCLERVMNSGTAHTTSVTDGKSASVGRSDRLFERLDPRFQVVAPDAMLVLRGPSPPSIRIIHSETTHRIHFNFPFKQEVRAMKWIAFRSFLLVLILGFWTTPPAMAADLDADGVDDDSSPFVDTDGDGVHDSQLRVEGLLATAEPPPEMTRDVLIVHESKPLAYFGWYRVSQMTPPGFEILRSTIDWLVGAKTPADSKLILFTYNGSSDTCDPQNADGAAVHRFLVSAGFTDIELHHQRDATTLPASYYNDFDAAIYWNSFPYEPGPILDSGIPFVSSALGHGSRMGIATGVSTLHEFRDTTYVSDNGHPISDAFPLGAVTFAGRMWTDASQATDIGRALVIADPLPNAISVAIDIDPRRDDNVVQPLRNKRIGVAILGSADFDVDRVDLKSLEFGPDRATPEMRRRVSFADVNHDGRLDLVSYYRTKSTGIAIGDTGACLNALTVDGFPLRGCDGFKTKPASKWIVIGD